jgi:hypothetical protein
MTINRPKTSKTGGKCSSKRGGRNNPSKTQHKINTEAQPAAAGKIETPQ